MRNMVEAQHLEEGNEIVLSPNTGAVGIVEDVSPAPWRGPDTANRVVILLNDGRTFRVSRTFPVQVLS